MQVSFIAGKADKTDKAGITGKADIRCNDLNRLYPDSRGIYFPRLFCYNKLLMEVTI